MFTYDSSITRTGRPFSVNYIVFPHDCLFLTLLFYQNHLVSSGKKRKTRGTFLVKLLIGGNWEHTITVESLPKIENVSHRLSWQGINLVFC
jgi:hypothetical protein